LSCQATNLSMNQRFFFNHGVHPPVAVSIGKIMIQIWRYTIFRQDMTKNNLSHGMAYHCQEARAIGSGLVQVVLEFRNANSILLTHPNLCFTVSPCYKCFIISVLSSYADISSRLSPRRVQHGSMESMVGRKYDVFPPQTWRNTPTKHVGNNQRVILLIYTSLYIHVVFVIPYLGTTWTAAYEHQHGMIHD